MNDIFFRRLAAATCAALFFLPAATAPAAQRTLSGSVPPVLARLALVPVSGLPSTNILNLAISLPVRDQAGLDLLLRQISDPASSNYQKYLTTAQFAAQFGASEQDYQAVVDFVQARGLTVTATHPNRLVLEVSGTAATVEAAFQIELKVFNHPTEARKFFAPTTEPVVSASLPILSIVGLENYYLPHSRMIPIRPASSSNQNNDIKPNVGSAPDGQSYMGSDFRKAYAPGVTLTGKGQSVGLLQFDGFNPGDIAAYAALIGLNNPPKVVVVPVNGGVPVPGSGNGEVCLDIEMVMSMAPGVSTIYVYEAPQATPWVSLLSRMANDNRSRQLSCSWGGGPTNAAAEQIFQQMAAQGQSFFNACGDDDAYVIGVNPVTFPADSPNITQVGGTVLTTGANSIYKSEKVWNDGTPYRTGYLGTGGGISPNYLLPYWQQGISMVANHGSTTNRNVPDVALTAKDVWVVSDNGQSGSSGGTSAAAPLWAGFTALINQQAARNAKPSVGFLNPTLYALAKTASYTNYLHDITNGDNTWPMSPTNFPAATNYDLCTGLGAPNGSALIYAIAGKPIPTGFLQVTVDPESGSTLLHSTTQDVFVTVGDGGLDVTNAIVTAVIPGVTNLVLRNDGQSPDAIAIDAVYSGSFQVPAGASSLTMTVIASATNEVGTTNVLYYSAVTVLNDNFANATKVPAAGAAYVSNNRQATIEPTEPAHNGDTNMAASLWWSWTPQTATNVLIDTIGSKIDTLLAVYTGSVLATNMPTVASASGSASQLQPAYLNFNAQAGVTYHIAVASVNSNSVGSLALHITPGGQLDTNAPSVAVTSPPSGLTVTSFGIKLSGVAFEAPGNATGVSAVTLNVNGVDTDASGTTNWTAAVALLPNLNTIQVTAVDASGNVSAPVNVQINYLVLSAPNDFFVNAIRLSGTSGVVSAGNTNATREAGEPLITGNPGGKSLWWSFTPPADGVLTLNTTNSTFDTLLGLYTGPDVADLSTIEENDDAYDDAPGGFSFISQAVKVGQTYKIAVDGYSGAFGNVSLSYAFVPAVFHHLTVESPGGTVQMFVTNVLGGITQLPGQSGDFANGSAVTLLAIPATTGQFNNWSGGVSSPNNPLTVVMQSDLDLTANFAPIAYSDGFESGDLLHLPWTTAGDAPWFVQTNVVAQGLFSASSGIINDSQTSSLILTTNFTAGTGYFDYKVSSEAGWDFLNFYVDGVLFKQWSGEVGWANYAFALNAGTHTLAWNYAKDASDSAGMDAAFIDDVNLPIVSPAPPPPPQLQLEPQSDGSLLMTLTGQGNGQYVIQTSADLLNWQNYSTNTASGGVIQITIPPNPANPAQFYRALAL
jgi:subtilase family serine protease